MSGARKDQRVRHRPSGGEAEEGIAPQKWLRRLRALGWTLATAETPAATVRAMRDLDAHAQSRIFTYAIRGESRMPRGKTVPLEPTRKMLDAAVLAEWAADPKDTDRYHAAVYRAMIARAPKGAGPSRGEKQG
jgi:hypothetical protein